MREKYVFRLSQEVIGELDVIVPPRQRGRSEFINDALVNFLQQGKKPLADRPHLRGRSNAYKQVCALLDSEQLEKAKNLYSEVSISVVIQAAVASEMASRRDKISDLQNRKAEVKTPDDRQNPDDYPNTASSPRKLAPTID